MEPLTEMQLLLREHGWEPEIERDNGPSYWEWKHPGHKGSVIFTWPLGDDRGAVKGQGQLWDEYFASRAQNLRKHKMERQGILPKKYLSVAGLKRRLKQLAVMGETQGPTK
jgi:hypothetical protein